MSHVTQFMEITKTQEKSIFTLKMSVNLELANENDDFLIF